jgi:uncharacterized protein YbjT (DUF2867 family)
MSAVAITGATYELTGSEALTLADVAARAGKVLGRELCRAEISEFC